MTARLNHWNAASYALLIALSGAAAVVVLGRLGIRIAEIAPNADVPLAIPFDGGAQLPVGVDGAGQFVTITDAVVRVSGMTPGTIAALIIAEALTAVTIVALLAMFAAFCRNLSRGRAFSRGSIRLLLAASGALVAGWIGDVLFRTLGVNGALGTLSGGRLDSAGWVTDFVPLVAAVALLLMAAAFEAGARLQRDTEGLV